MAISITQPPGGSINAPLGSGAAGGPNAFGEPYITELKGLSSDITATMTNVLAAYGGDIWIENIIFETDATGLATGTNLQFGSDDTLGSAVFWADAISGLGANVTHDIFTASVTKQRAVIASGKHLQIGCTGSACTGAGAWKACVMWRPVATAAVLAK